MDKDGDIISKIANGVEVNLLTKRDILTLSGKKTKQQHELKMWCLTVKN